MSMAFSWIKYILIITFISGILFILLAFIFLALDFFSVVDLTKNHVLNITGHHEFSLIVVTIALAILTGVLAYVAYIELDSLNKTSKSDFLLRIDERYSSCKILKARQILREMYCESASGLEEAKDIEKKVSDKIKNMAKAENKGESEDFILLLNFLDFLETVAYYKNEKKVDGVELDELIGGSLERYERMLSGLIDYINELRKNDATYPRKKHGYNPYYCELRHCVEEQRIRNREATKKAR